ncbi:MAG: hypothetical protein AB7F31_06220 [Parachlamydiales bacterium]
MDTVGSIVKFMGNMTGKTEAGFRLLKAGESYLELGFRCTGIPFLKNAEELFKSVTGFQNLYRVFKALSLYRELNKVKNDKWTEGGLNIEGETGLTDAEKAAAHAHNYCFSILSPTTLLVVSVAGFTKFLVDRNVLPLSGAWAGRLGTFGKYGGGYFGNVVAAIAGSLGAWNLYRAAEIAENAGDKDKAKRLKVLAGASAFGAVKYGLDAVTTLIEEFLPKGSYVLFAIKAVSRHTALLQSACGAAEEDIWGNIVSRATA